MCISVVCHGEEQKRGRRKYADGLKSTSKDDRVIRVQIVFITQGNQEDYPWLLEYLFGLKLRPGEWICCGDYKVEQVLITYVTAPGSSLVIVRKGTRIISFSQYMKTDKKMDSFIGKRFMGGKRFGL